MTDLAREMVLLMLDRRTVLLREPPTVVRAHRTLLTVKRMFLVLEIARFTARQLSDSDALRDASLLVRFAPLEN